MGVSGYKRIEANDEASHSAAWGLLPQLLRRPSALLGSMPPFTGSGVR